MKAKQWILIIVSATILFILIRMFVFETILVASPSMSESCKPNDRLIVEKISLGPRLPMSIGLPFFPDSIFGHQTFLTLTNQAKRLFNKSDLRRNDIIAFNKPTPNEVYSRNPVLLSRCVGLPGETIQLTNTEIKINGKQIRRPIESVNCYGFPMTSFRKIKRLLETAQITKELFQNQDTGFIYLTKYEWLKLYKWKGYDSLYLALKTSYNGYKIVIPNIGYKIDLNDSTLNIYGKLIRDFEHVKIQKDTAGIFLKNGHKSNKYVFQKNYFFMLNDHQGYMNDSRGLGLIPEELFIGKSNLILFSPKEKRFMQLL